MKALRERYFRYLFAGHLISEIGEALFNIALFWYIQEATGRPEYIALVGLMMSLPQFLTIFTSFVIDIMDRIKLMIFFDIGRLILVFLLAFYTLFFGFNLAVILPIIFLVGMLGSLYFPATRAVLSNLISQDVASSANGLLNAASRLSLLVAAMIGAFLLSGVDAVYFLFLNGVSFLMPIFGLIAIQRNLNRSGINNKQVEDKQSDKSKQVSEQPSLKRMMLQNWGRWWSSFKEGILYWWRLKYYRYSLPGIFLTNVFFTVFFTMAPAWSDQILHEGSFGYATLEFSLGLGVLIGALMASMISDRLLLNKGQMLGFGCQSMIIFYPLFTVLYFNMGTLFVMGFGIGVTGALGMTLMQRIVPNKLQGRVLGAVITIQGGATPIGMMLTGYMVSSFGIYTTYWIASIGLGIGAIYLSLMYGYHKALQDPTVKEKKIKLSPQRSDSVPGPPLS